MEEATSSQMQQRLQGSILDPGLLQRLSENVAAEIFDTLDELLGLDVNVVGNTCSELGAIVVFRVLDALCPELLGSPADEALPSYDELLPAYIRRQVVRHLADIMGANAHTLHARASLQELMTVAKELVNATLDEIVPTVLDQPVGYAHALARSCNRVAVRLYGLTQQQEPCGEHANAYRKLAWWVLYDVVRETCPHYLPKQPTG